MVRTIRLALVPAVLLAFAGCAGERPPGDARVPVAETVDYTIRIPRPGAGRFEVEVAADRVGLDSLDFVLPGWTPGQYGTGADRTLVENFFAADGGGEAVPARRLGRTVWRLYPAGARYLTVSYRILSDPGDEPLASRTRVDLHSGYAMGAGLMGTLTGLERRPVTVAFDLPPGWRVFSPLDPSGPSRFRAASYASVPVAPFVMGDRVRDYKLFVSGRSHAITVQGEAPEFVPDSLLRLVEEAVDDGTRFLGRPPYERYLFAVHFEPPEEGGFGAIGQQGGSAYFLPQIASRRLRTAGIGSLLLHQYLHAWIPGRFGPVGFVQPDWVRPPPFDDLWFIEGVAEYYSRLLPVRYGRADREEFYETLGVLLTLWRDLDGGPRIDLASLGTAVRGASDPRAVERLIVGGTLGAFFTDLAIRDAGAGDVGLDAVIRELIRASPPSGYDGRQMWPVVAASLGVPESGLGPLGDRAPVPIEVGLSRAGLAVELVQERVKTLGARLVPGSDRRFVVRAVTPGGTAASAGLEEGDALLKINSIPVSPAEVVATNYARETYIRSVPVGTGVTFTVERGGVERRLDGRVREVRVTRARVREVADAGPEEVAIRTRLFSRADEATGAGERASASPPEAAENR